MTIWSSCVASHPKRMDRHGDITSRYDICITVVTYGATSPLSKTVRSIFRLMSLFEGKNVALVIWSNGPGSYENSVLASFKELVPIGCDVVVCEDTRNIALSDIYNETIDSIDSDLHCILDDDSELSVEFVESICSPEASDVLVPKIMVNDVHQGPILNGKLIGAGQFNLRPTDDFFAIASGVTLTRSIISNVKEQYGQVFDSAYALYGVDTSFCLRLVEVARTRSICVRCAGYIDHDLSRLKPSVARSTFRRSERGLDLGITLRRYPRWKFWRGLISSFVRSLSSTRTTSFPSVVKGYLAGRHPRSSLRQK